MPLTSKTCQPVYKCGDGGTPVLLTGAALAVAGLGMGVLLPSLTVLVLECCSPREQGRYSAALQVAQDIGQVLLMGVAGVLFNAGSGPGTGAVRRTPSRSWSFSR